MSVTQSAYSERIRPARAGEIANTQTCDIDTYIADEANGIGFGLATRFVVNTSADRDDRRHVRLGLAAPSGPAFNAANFAGVSVKDITRDGRDGDEYKDGANAAILWRGDIWVQVDGDVDVDDIVTVNVTNGEFGARAAAATHALIPRARWITKASDNELAILRVGA